MIIFNLGSRDFSKGFSLVPNCFMLYRQDRAKYFSECPSKVDSLRQIAMDWKKETQSTKLYYERKSELLRIQMDLVSLENGCKKRKQKKTQMTKEDKTCYLLDKRTDNNALIAFDSYLANSESLLPSFSAPIFFDSSIVQSNPKDFGQEITDSLPATASLSYLQFCQYLDF